MKLIGSLLVTAYILVACSGSQNEAQEGSTVASFAAGTYKGTGEATALTLKQACSNVHLTFTYQTNIFSIEERVIKCGSYTSTTQKPILLDIRGNDLYYKGTLVGSIRSDRIQFSYSQDGYKVAVLFQANGVDYTYNESWTAADISQNVQISTTLRKQ